MSLSGLRRKQKAGAFLSLLLAALCTLVVFLLFSMDSLAAPAMRSRVYGFRNTDNKEAMQLVGKLGFKVTIDAHSTSVVVLTGDDAEELTRAYTLMEIADQKEPVILKVLGTIPDSKAEAVIDAIHDQLKTSNIGTLLNPPAKAVADPLVVDIYQGELIAIAAESQMAKIETAYKSLQDKEPASQPKISEPNIAAPVVTPAQPDKTESRITTVEPNISEVMPEPIESFVVEPNKPVEQEMPAVQPVAVSVEPHAVEPNQAKLQDSGTQEDFISDELLKALDIEEKKAEVQKASLAKPQSVEVKEAVETQLPREITADEFKKIVAQLMKEAAEEEKKTAVQQAPDANAAVPDVKPAEPIAAEATVKETPQPQKESVKPVVHESKPAAEKSPVDADSRVKVADAKSSLPKAEEELELTITLPEKVEIKQLIELVGKQLGLNYMYDETKVRGEVMLKVHDGKIKVKDCYALLESVLRFRGFVMTRRGNLVTIVPSAEINMSDPKIRMPDEPIEPGDIIINSVFPLKHISINAAQTVLRSLTLGTNIIPVVETNSLIVTDYSYRMAKIEEMLKFLDVEGKPKIFAHRQLEYMQAAVLIPRLQTLAAQLEHLSITVGSSAAASTPGVPARVDPRTGQPVPGAPAPTPMPSVPSAAAASSAAQTVYLDADERTNRILMVGTEAQLKTVNELIDTLDVRQRFLRYVKEYEIKNVDAAEVINVLNELGLATVSITTKSTDQAARQPVSQPARPGVPATAARPATPQAQAATGQASSIDQPSISIRPNTNSLLVNATVEQHEDIELVIKHIDVTQKDQRTIEEYEIQNVDAKEVVQTLGDLSIISKDSVSNITTSKSSMYDSQMSSRSGRSGRYGTQQQSPFPQQGMPGAEGGMEPSVMVSLPMAEGGTVRELITTEPQISILETTNSLLIYATPRQHASVALVIAHVDRELTQNTAPYVIYPLENQDPEELADTLTSLIEGTMKRSITSGGAQQPGAGPSSMDNRIRTEDTASNLPKKEEERITIIPEVQSYSLIVYANKKNQQWIATLIKELDQYRPQVLLDCTLVQITKDESFKYDLDIISKTYSDLSLRSPSPISTISGDFSPSSYGEARSTSGTFTGFFNSDMIQGLLEAVETKGYGRVMSKPKILVNDNQEGEIKTENKTSIAQKTSSTIPGTGGTDPIITDSVNFQEYSEGVTLTIKPHISKGDMLRLEIGLTRTDFKLQPDVTVANIPYPRPPDLISTDVKTVATVPDGTTIILGGLEDLDQQKNHTKVPILGDIPLVGGLFRGIDNKGNQGRLYVFVKANVIRPGNQIEGIDDIRRISEKYREQFEEMEGAFQDAQDWPGIPPKPKYPEQVLEDDEYIQRLRAQQAEKAAAEKPVN